MSIPRKMRLPLRVNAAFIAYAFAKHLEDTYFIKCPIDRIELVWHSRLTHCMGGKFLEGDDEVTGIVLAVGLLYRFPDFREYDEYADDPAIGSFEGSFEKRLLAAIAHEVAHVAMINWNNDESHGENWRTMYRNLRQTFVNHWE